MHFKNCQWSIFIFAVGCMISIGVVYVTLVLLGFAELKMFCRIYRDDGDLYWTVRHYLVAAAIAFGPSVALVTCASVKGLIAARKGMAEYCLCIVLAGFSLSVFCHLAIRLLFTNLDVPIVVKISDVRRFQHYTVFDSACRSQNLRPQSVQKINAKTPSNHDSCELTCS